MRGLQTESSMRSILTSATLFALLSGPLQAAPTPTSTPTALACGLSDGQAATLVLGQSALNAATANAGGVSASSLSSPYRLGSDGTRLAVPDAANNRVLIWNSLPTASGQPADVVLGQADFSSNAANRGAGAGANTLNFPSSARIEAGKLVVADYGNNRVLIWNSVPTVNGQAADVVVGQADMTSNGINRGNGTAAPSVDSLYQPASARILAGQLMVLDTFNHRLLLYSGVPSADGASAVRVVGQSLFTTNSGGLSPAKMLYPNDVESDGTRLYVVDANNNRVLGWSAMPAVDGQAADFVLGQSTLGGSASAAGAQGLYAMNALLLHGGDLYVSDYGNNRVLRYSPAPTANQPAASLVLGQADFNGASANRGGSVAANTLSWPYGLVVAGGSLWVTDKANNRVLRYACSVPATPTASATPTPTPTSVAWATPCPAAPNIPACSWTGLGQPGDLLMTLNGAGLIAGFNRTTATWYLFATTTAYVDGITTFYNDPTSIVVTQQNQGDLERFNALGQSQGLYGTTNGTNNKIGAFNPLDGSFWVPDQSASQLWRIPPGGGAAVLLTVTGTTLYHPTGAVFDAAGNFYLTNASNQNVIKVAAANTSSFTPAATVLANGMSNLLGIDYDGQGALYAAGWAASSPSNTSSLWRIDASTGAKTLVCDSFAPLSENGGGQLYQTDGVVIDPDGNFWMSQFQNPGTTVGMLKISPAGVPLAFYVLPGTIGGRSTAGSSVDDLAVIGQASPRAACGVPATTPCASTATSTTTPTPTASATPACPDCATYDGIHGFNAFHLQTEAGGPGFGTGAWKGAAGAAPVYVQEDSGYDLSGFVARGGRGEGRLSYGGAQWDPTATYLSAWFQVSSAAAPAEMVLMDLQHAGYRVRLSVFGPGHADFGKLKVVYSSAGGQQSAYIPWAYGSGPYDDTHTGGGLFSSARSVLAVSMRPCSLAVLPGYLDPATKYQPSAPAGLSFNDYGPHASVTGDELSFGNDQALGAPVDGYFDDIRVYRCAGWTAPTATATATPTASSSQTPFVTMTPTATATATPSSSAVLSSTPSATPTPTATPSRTPATTRTATSTATATPSATAALPSATASATRTVSPTATRSWTPGAVPTATAAPTKVHREDRRLDCHPNFVQGHGGKIRVQARSYSGGRCAIKVNRANGRGVCELWRGDLQPQEIRRQDWDTRDSGGGECASGVYYVVFTDGDGGIQVQKVLIAR